MGPDTGAQSLPEDDSGAEALDVIGPLMLEITRAWLKEFDLRLKPLGLSQARWRALYEIWINKGEPLSQNELAGRLNVEDPRWRGCLIAWRKPASCAAARIEPIEGAGSSV
jgi:hypothetical protein